MAKKTRMNVNMRKDLREFAKNSVIADPETQKAFVDAYKKAAALLAPVIEQKYPRKDMELLRHYKVAHPDSCVQCVDRNGRFMLFYFDVAEAPLLPTRGCRDRAFAVDDLCMTAVDEWSVKKHAALENKKQVLQHYHNLIQAARYAEEVLEVWPASRSVLSPYMEFLPVPLSKDTLDFIRSNNAGAEKEAA